MDPDDRSVPDRVIVRGDRRMPLRVVTDMDEQLVDLLRHVHAVEELRGGGALLDDGRVGVARAAVGVSDGVGAPLGDRCEQSLGGQRPLETRTGAEAISGYATHKLILGRKTIAGTPLLGSSYRLFTSQARASSSR